MATALLAQLAGSTSERSAAYAALESTHDASLAEACVVAVVAVLGRPASEVGTSEFRRCSLVIAHLAQLDPVRVGGRWSRDMSLISALAAEASAEGNALSVIAAKAPEQMTKDDARTAATAESALMALFILGADRVLDAGGEDRAMPSPPPDHAWENMRARGQGDEAKMISLAKLTIDLLRDDREELSDQSEAEVAGAWCFIANLCQSCPEVVSLAVVQAGMIEMAIAELRTGVRTQAVACDF